MKRSLRFLLLGLALLAPLGCKTERPPTRDQLAAQRLASMAATPVGPSPVRRIDDTQLVLARCGAPVSDQMFALYDKLQNGPLRRMTYVNGQTVTLDFIPVDPLAHPSDAGTTMQRPAIVQAPAHAIWRFSEAHMQQHDMLTAKRLAFYLPCAAAALYPEN